jgi:pimeloyl-ACP methyl ester carboxylesterase
MRTQLWGRLLRIGFSLLATVVVLLSAVASGYTQSDGQVFLPLVQQSEQSVVASDHEQEEQEDKLRPTIVLVHGAWADGTGWQEVIKRLDRAGYPVTAVQNPLTSLADDVATTKRVLDAQTGPTIVVGHSYGGAVITGAAVGNPNVKALVYIAAFGPAAGEPLGLLLQQYPTELGQILVFDAAGFGYLNRERFRPVFAADVDRTTARVMAAAQKPAFGGIFAEHLDAVAWATIPSWYMVAKEDKALHPDMERFVANRMGATIVEINSSHVPFISQPDEVVKLIEKAARATVP